MPSREELRNGFQLGTWLVMPERNLLRSADDEASLERLAMDVLVQLALHQGELVTKDDLVETVWEGRPQMDDVITQKISLIRKALNDHGKPHLFVETIFGRGYRLRMPLDLLQPAEPVQEPKAAPAPWYLSAWVFGLLAIGIVIALVFIKPDKSTQVIPGDAMRSVVVFPFQCSRADDEYLCDGFSVMLASTLAQLDDLKIVKSRTPFPTDLTEPQIAAQFGVDGVIWGEVSRIGGALVVNADLVDGRSGFLKFSNVYDTAEDTLLDTQELVANDVRTSIRGSQAPELRTAVRPASYDVLEMFWKADYEFAKRSPRSIIAAIGLFEQAIAMDPEYGPAYLKLAYATVLLPDYVPGPRKEAYDRALQIAAEGTAKDPSMTVQHAAIVGFVHHKREQWIASQESFEAALMVDSDAFEIHHLYSRLLASVGRLDAALEQAQLARALDPHSGVLISRLAITHYWMNDLDNAEALFELTHEQPEFVLPVNDLAYALLYIRKNDIEAATLVAEAAFINLERDASWVRPVFAGLRDETMREDALQRVTALSESQELPPIVLLSLWTLFGEYDRAMNVAGLLRTQGEIFEAEILFSEDFRQLRNHADFLPLLESIGITEYWTSVGCRWENSAVVCGNSDQI